MNTQKLKTHGFALAITAVLSMCTLFDVTECAGFTTIQTGNWVLDVSDYELPFTDAVEACRSMSKVLLTVDTEEKDRTLYDLFVKDGETILPGNNSWIAATELREGVWIWKTAEQPILYSRWMISQPDDAESLNCAYQAVQALLYWRDANCSAPMYFICESEATPAPAGRAASLNLSATTAVVGIRILATLWALQSRF